MPPPAPPRPAAGGRPTPPSRPQAPGAAGGRPVGNDWSFDPNGQASINDGGFRNLPIGEHHYLIKKVTFEPRRNANPPENQVVFLLDHNGTGDEYPQSFGVCSPEQQRREMANKQVTGFCNACEVTARINPGNINALFADKWVRITTVAKPDKTHPEIVRVNIQRIDPPDYGDDAQEADTSNGAAEEPDNINYDESPQDGGLVDAGDGTTYEEPAAEEAVETPAPAATRPTRQAAPAKPAATQPAPAPAPAATRPARLAPGTAPQPPWLNPDGSPKSKAPAKDAPP